MSDNKLIRDWFINKFILKVFDENEIIRWPEGAPGGKGGQFAPKNKLGKVLVGSAVVAAKVAQKVVNNKSTANKAKQTLGKTIINKVKDATKKEIVDASVFNPAKTAINRGGKSSVPMKTLNNKGLLKGRKLDYGCGYGDDAKMFGMDAYDKYHEKNPKFRIRPKRKYDTITCNYVLNVNPIERKDILKDIQNLLKPDGLAYITVRRDKKHLIGVTSTKTFQENVILNLPIIDQKSGRYTIYVMKKNDDITKILTTQKK